MATGLLSHIANAIPGIDYQSVHGSPTTFSSTMPQPPTPAFMLMPINETIGFHSLLPILYFVDWVLATVPGTAPLDVDSNIDFLAHDKYVLAMGGFLEDGQPAWHTSLVPRKHLLTEQAKNAHATCLPMPLTGIIIGGRNSVLISPHADPTTEAAMDTLFTTPGHYKHAKAYTE
jgi:hypothetical protein